MEDGAVFWLTGLSGAGKSTLAFAAADILRSEGLAVTTLDGDVLRTGLCRDLGFSQEDRIENNRRSAEVARILALSAKQICLCSFISPTRDLRSRTRAIIGDVYREIFVQCTLSKCIERDPKGNYKKALSGKLPGYTGIDAVYEEPEHPDLVISTETAGIPESTAVLVDFIHRTLTRGAV
ncbi:MAG: adenylyl-sulfate kinase [Desulfovibrionaceae bacterium]|nr:adenylyl-sulfate kinase [Desulfovibrionaceae bacterium]